VNEIRIVVQAKGDPKNLLSNKQKQADFHTGMTVVFMEAATEGGQLGIEFIVKGEDINGNHTINAYAITENNMEALMGAFIGTRMRFGRMPKDQWEMVRHYVKQQATRFLEQLPVSKLQLVGDDVKKFFGI
jgi:hypothetical protein